jgi:predicted TPR repeat methyltransferase
VVTLAWLERGQLNEREGRMAQAVSAYGDYLRAHPNSAGADALRVHVDDLRRGLERSAA